LNFRYLFRYLLLGFPSALGSQKGQKRAAKRPQKPKNDVKSSKTKIHVGLAKNINNVVVNSSQMPINKGIVGFLFF
jgi:hypothetical protein